MAKAWSLRYLTAKLRLGIEEALGTLPTSSSMTVAVQKGIEAYSRELTTVMYLTGAAMAPTLNPAALSSNSAGLVDGLLVRLIPRPSERSVFSGDVVAFNSPLSPAAAAAAAAEQQSVLVRRVAAVPGDEMVSDDPDVRPFKIPEGHCWVLADNDQLQPAEVIDSRSFGPLPLSNVMGRIMYFYRSHTDSGVVENSPEATSEDEAVLEAELDLAKFRRSD